MDHGCLSSSYARATAGSRIQTAVHVLLGCRVCTLHAYTLPYTKAGSIAKEPCHFLSPTPPALQPRPLLRPFDHTGTLKRSPFATSMSLSESAPSSKPIFARGVALPVRLSRLPTPRHGPHNKHQPLHPESDDVRTFQTGLKILGWRLTSQPGILLIRLSRVDRAG